MVEESFALGNKDQRDSGYEREWGSRGGGKGQ